MKPKFSDPDFRFSSPEKDHHRKMVEDTRRHRIQLEEVSKKAPWKITKGDQGPMWEFHRDNTGKITLAKQLRPHPGSMDENPQHRGKRFVVVIEGQNASCCIGGEGVEAGCRVESFADAAYSLHGIRGRIIEEISA